MDAPHQVLRGLREVNLKVAPICGLAFTVVLLLSGCSAYHEPSKAPKRELLVGTYVLWSGDSGENLPPDKLSLEANGTFVLTHMVGGRPGTKEEGRWQLFDDGPGWSLGLGHHGYPIWLSGEHVHLVVDSDLNIWYDKSVAPKGLR